MTTPAFRIHLTDLRQLVPALEDVRRVGVLTDLRQLVPALLEVGVPEVTQGAVINVVPRVPALTTTGTPAMPSAAASPWHVVAAAALHGSVGVQSPAVELPAGYRYTPGATRGPEETSDVLQITDALGASWDFWFIFGRYVAPATEASVAIGEDGIFAAPTGGQVQWSATGGTGPYTWEMLSEAEARSPSTGGNVTAGGLYTAGPAFGWDRLKVTDSLGAIAYATVQVDPLVYHPRPDSEADWVFGEPAIPYAFVAPAGGTAPYTVAFQANGTGATLEDPKPLRAFVSLASSEDGSPVDTAGWTGEARVYSQRGALLAEGLVVTATAGGLEVALPDPSTILYPVAVLRIVAHPASGLLAAMASDLPIEILLRKEYTP